jgi:hypothetical protein
MKKIIFISFILIVSISKSNAQTFTQFWINFQKNINSKDSMLVRVSFPYSYSCNYLGDGEITKEQFSKDGTEIIVNGNAFISNTFSVITYPSIESLSIKLYKDGYLNDYLKTQFLKKYGNLNEIYFIAEKGNEDSAIGYKAYFKKIKETFLFIGFEGEEQGD